MSVQSDIGPSAPPRWRVYAQARELAQLVEVARECSTQGPRENLPRALAAFDRMRAILGPAGYNQGDEQ